MVASKQNRLLTQISKTEATPSFIQSALLEAIHVYPWRGKKDFFKRFPCILQTPHMYGVKDGALTIFIDLCRFHSS